MIVCMWFDRYYEKSKASGKSWTLIEVSQFGKRSMNSRLMAYRNITDCHLRALEARYWLFRRYGLYVSLS